MSEAARLRVGLTQWRATRELAANLSIASQLIERCADEGADLVVLPENGLFLGSNQEMRAAALELSSEEIQTVAAAAQRHATAVLIGGFKCRYEDRAIRNSAVLFDATGALVAIYDKIHLFDARIGSQSFAASSVERAGTRPVIVDIDGVGVGITICYDLRFPELYRQLALAGAQVLLIPAAFTQSTGAAHWETLLRARAIENACFVAAPATVRGTDGADSFETYGHGLAVDPWGRVLADLEIASPVARVIEFDMSLVEAARRSLPVLKSVRPEAYRATPLRAELKRPVRGRELRS
jgi:deaminated glutathione amidase